jgi:hypothetical protein
MQQNFILAALRDTRNDVLLCRVTFLLKSAFLGAFAKLRKATISLVMSVSVCLSVRPSIPPPVCPSVRMEQLGFHRTDFHEMWYLSAVRKSVEKFKCH